MEDIGRLSQAVSWRNLNTEEKAMHEDVKDTMIYYPNHFAMKKPTARVPRGPLKNSFRRRENEAAKVLGLNRKQFKKWIKKARRGEVEIPDKVAAIWKRAQNDVT